MSTLYHRPRSFRPAPPRIQYVTLRAPNPPRHYVHRRGHQTEVPFLAFIMLAAGFLTALVTWLVNQ
jgi:hypothetical protein